MKKQQTTSINTVKYAILGCTILVNLVLIVFNNQEVFELFAGDSDSFFTAFYNFQKLGFYNGCANGYGLLYFGSVSFFFSLTDNINQSFFWVNFLSQIAIVIVALKTIWFFKSKSSLYYFLSLFTLLATQTINLKSYTSAYNDTFLGVFVVLILYVFITKIIFDFDNKYHFLKLGVLLAIALSIRETTIALGLSCLFGIVYLKFANSISWQLVGKNLLFAIIPFIILTSMLHYPSLKEHNKLCFYDKNPKVGANWVQRNFLGLTKIKNGQETVHRDAIWARTKFDAVNEYLAKNGHDALPRTLFKAFLQDPVLVSSIFGYNIIYSILFTIRFYGLIFLYIAFLFFSKRQFIASNVLFFMTLFFYSFLSFVCFTFIETRWFVGYEVLVPLSFLLAANKFNFIKQSRRLDVVFIISLVLVSSFNLISISKIIF